MSEDEYKPDWSNHMNWDEFDWEMSMRHSDSFASKYFSLLDKFGDLPGSDDIILKQMGETCFSLMEENDYYIDFDSEDMQEIEEGGNENFEGGFYYENNPAYMLLRQVAIGWCNIYATFLLPEHRKHGVNILFHLGRAMAYLAGSLGDGQYENVASNLASGKRAADQLNRAIGQVEQLNQFRPAYKKITEAINKHLRKVHSKIVDHLILLRSK